ncbi:MAG: hypothetical protein H6Q69_656 [Firmicutes bacterium]|nr:hypothetical protein [Bacillota bacterium]
MNIINQTINTHKGRKNSNSIKIPEFVLAILPIFSPYILLGPISVNMILLCIATVLVLVLNSRFSINRHISYLWLLHFFLSILAFFSTDYNIALFNSMLSISYSIICFSVLWSRCNIKVFEKYANYIGIGCCLFLFYQAVQLALGGEPPSGQLFNLPLLHYAGWVSETWGFRLNSVFQEPSYFAIFCLPLLAVNMQLKNYILSTIYILALTLSSSSLGILGALIIVVYYFLAEKRELKQSVLIILCILVVHILFFYVSDYYNTAFERSLDKVLSIFDGNDSVNIRILGQIYLFESLPEFNQIFGVGVSQMKNYFASIGVNVFNYSNSFIATLINTGIVGLMFYIVFHMVTTYYCYKRGRLIFDLIFVMICAIDQFIYNFFFFYLLTFIYLSNEESSDENFICNT